MLSPLIPKFRRHLSARLKDIAEKQVPAETDCKCQVELESFCYKAQPV